MPLKLRPLRLDDEDVVVAGHEAMLSDNFFLLTGWHAGDDWAQYVRSLDMIARSTEVSAERVPGTILVAEINGTIVGRASIRFALNDWLAFHAGHIGYGVFAEHRRKGYASEILRQAVIIARSHGVNRVLVTCAHDNLASAGVIERGGGVLERVVPASDEDVAFRRYWID